MKVYHGTTEKNARNILDKGIDLRKSNRYLDFGRGFYVTPDLDMARNMAFRVAMRENKMITSRSAVLCFEYTENPKLIYKIFDRENTEWAKFVMTNRLPDKIVNDLGWKEDNIGNKYDIVMGGAADGGVANIASDLRYGKICPQDYKLQLRDFLKNDGSSYGTQIVFCTEKALSCIKYVKCDIFNQRGDEIEKKNFRI